MEKLQRLGKALMGAVAVMPVAAILMGIGYWIDPSGWGANNIIAAVLIKAGGAVLDNLGWLFAIAIGYGLSKDSNGAAALAGFLGYATVKLILAPGAVAGYKGIDVASLEGDALLDWKSHGWDAINDKNVLIGILVGIMAAWVYNRFHNTRLPDALAFFSGRRLVPILTSIFAIALALVLYFVWPLVYSALFNFGEWIQGLGAAGAGLYGFANRLLIRPVCTTPSTRSSGLTSSASTTSASSSVAPPPSTPPRPPPTPPPARVCGRTAPAPSSVKLASTRPASSRS